jgi:hypothetical protein
MKAEKPFGLYIEAGQGGIDRSPFGFGFIQGRPDGAARIADMLFPGQGRMSIRRPKRGVGDLNCRNAEIPSDVLNDLAE